MTFAEKLISLRKLREMTQEELASAIFVSRSMIAKYETGKAYPTNEILQRISDYFEVSIDELVKREDLINEHSKALENHISKKQKIETIVAIIGVLLVAITAILSIIKVEKTEYVFDYVQIEWDADFARWNLIYFEESNPDISTRRAHIYLTEWETFENSRTKIQFTIEGEDWYAQYNKYNVSKDYRELTSATLYYRVTITKNLLGAILEREGYHLEKVDFHLNH